jgi:hypothetical protein
MNMNMRNTMTLARAGSEEIKEEISLLMEGTAFILLRGRNTLKVRKAFIFGIPGIASINLDQLNLPNDNHNEINPIPPVAQVCFGMNDEPHGNDFNHAFSSESITEYFPCLFHNYVVWCDPVSVIVVVKSHEN